MALVFEKPDDCMNEELQHLCWMKVGEIYSWFDTATGKWMTGSGPNPFKGATRVACCPTCSVNGR